MLSVSPQLRQLASALRPALGLELAEDAPEPDLELAKFASERHRIGALLYRAWNLHADTGEAAMTYLERISANNIRRELRQKAVARKFGDMLDAQGIGWIEFKGWRLGEQLYGESALRQSKDVDLLIEPGRLLDALDLAARHGYFIGGRTGAFAHRRARWVLRHHREIGVVDPAMQVQIELHSRLFDYPPQSWRDPVIDADDRKTAMSLADPNYVLYLIIHGAMTGWKRLKWLCDLLILAQKVSPEVRRVSTERARALGCEPALVASLLAIADLWDEDAVGPWLAQTQTAADHPLVLGHLAAITRRLGLAGQPPFAERAMRHAGILRDAPVFDHHPAPLRALGDRAALWLLARV